FSGRDNFTAYGKPFDEDEHVRLRAALDRLSQETGGMTSITISNSDTPETRRIYQGYRMNAIQAPRSVGARTRESAPEVIATLRCITSALSTVRTSAPRTWKKYAC
ncbi:TPA: DNA adenine methylase, partial [Escherichia coli]|nr:DNA adenine methylase [Escherichia coli]HAJ8956981.1 DNA adenine methylase [Escherichia coli]